MLTIHLMWFVNLGPAIVGSIVLQVCGIACSFNFWTMFKLDIPCDLTWCVKCACEGSKSKRLNARQISPRKLEIKFLVGMKF